MRPLAFIAVRTTGADPNEDEIVELAALRVDALGLEVERQLALEVLPEYFGRALGDEEAFLRDALAQLEPVLDGAVLAGHELDPQLAFLNRAWALQGQRPANLGAHHLDTASLAWSLCGGDDLGLEGVCRALGVDEDLETAMGRAAASLEIARRVLSDRRDEASDAHAVVVDVLHALQRAESELARIDRARRHLGLCVPTDRVRTRRVYVCHPFRDDPVRNTERVRDICVDLVDEGYLPLAPHLFLPQLLDDTTRRELAMRLCLELIDDCDEVRVYGADITEGMREEIARAEALGLPVRHEYPLGAEPGPLAGGR